MVDKRRRLSLQQRAQKPSQDTIGFTLGEMAEIRDFRINSGCYDTVQDLSKEMKNAVGRQSRAAGNLLQKKGDELKFRYNEVNRKVIISMQTPELLALSHTLATKLHVIGMGIYNHNPTPYVYKGEG